MQSLFPTAPTELSDDDLAALYAYPSEWPWVRANFVSSLDGAAHGNDARSRSLSSQADQRVFTVLRSLADLVVVGGRTARAEAYQPVLETEVDSALRTRLGLTPVPAIAVVSRSIEIDAGLLAGGAAPTMVVTTRAAAEEHDAELAGVAVIVASPVDHPERLDLGGAMDALVAAGYQRLLCEGGPSLMRDLVATGRLDELCLTLSPQLVGGDPLRILHGPSLPRAARLELRHLLEADGDLFCRYIASR